MKVRIAIALGLLFAIAPIAAAAGRRAAARASPTIDSPGCSGASSASSITTSPRTRAVQQDFYGEPWLIDGPAAEQNLSRRVKTATSIDVQDPIVLTLDDPRLFTYPWIYFVEPGNLALTDSDAKTLREFLLRGGTALFDDFHGPFEWDHLRRRDEEGVPRSRDRRLPEGSSGLQLLLQARWLSADRRPRLVPAGPQLGEGRLRRAPAHDFRRRQRPMLFINWNTDMGDGWEWSNAEDYPGYIKYTSMAYRMGINEVVYALTH